MKLIASRGRVIVRFHPYRREGVIEIPDKYQPESSEATIEHDSDGVWEKGTTVICSLMDGTYFKIGDVRYCTLKRESVFLIYTEKDGKIHTVRPAHRAVLSTVEEPIKETNGIELPQTSWRLRNFGNVLATGPGEWDFKSGQRVYFEERRAGKIKIDGKAAYLVPESLIQAVDQAA